MNYPKSQQTKTVTKKVKKKQSDRKKLIRELDLLITHIVQLRDRKCYTCGKTEGIYCGHFHSRTHYGTRWDLMNCHAQCNPCNLRHEQDPWPYTQFMLKTYNKRELDELYTKHRQVTHFKIKDLEKMKENYTKILDIYKDI